MSDSPTMWLDRERKRLLKQDKENCHIRLAEKAEEAERTHNHKVLFQTIKKIKGKGPSAISQVKAADGSTLESEEEQLDRWKEHFRDLLNRPPPPPSDLLDQFAEAGIPDPTISTDAPTESEVKKAVKKLKSGRAAGPDAYGINPEMLKD